MLGIWKNFQDIEESLTLPELEALISQSREAEYRKQQFMAAIQGIDLGEAMADQNKEKWRQAQLRAEATLGGKSAEQAEFDDIGLGLEVENDEGELEL